MKYLAILLIGVIITFVATNARREREPHEETHSSSEDIFDAALIDIEEPLPGPPIVEVSAEKKPASEGSVPDGKPAEAPKKTLEEQVFAALEKIVSGGSKVVDNVDVYDGLAQALRDEGIMVGATAELAIRDTLKDIVDDISKAGIQGVGSLTGSNRRWLDKLAGTYAADIRSRAVPRSSAHQGNQRRGRSIDDVLVPDGFTKLNWKALGGYEFTKGMTLPKSVTGLDGKKVALTGFMMAMGEFEDIHEFLLVESMWSCCFGTPPEVNQVVVIRIPKDETGTDLITAPVLVTGKFEASEEVEDGWVVSVYRVTAEDVEEID